MKIIQHKQKYNPGKFLFFMLLRIQMFMISSCWKQDMMVCYYVFLLLILIISFISFEILIASFLPPNPPIYASLLFFKFMASFFVVTYIYVYINACICVFVCVYFYIQKYNLINLYNAACM